MKTLNALAALTLVFASACLAGGSSGGDGSGGNGPGGAGSGVGDGSGGNGPGGDGSSGGPIGDLPFDAGAMGNVLYECADADETQYFLQLAPQGTLQIAAQDTPNTKASGSYTLAGEIISLTIPEVGLSESSVDQKVVFGVLGVFVTPSLYCHAVALKPDAGQSVLYRCPLSNHIPDVSYEDDEIVLRDNGSVYWRHWDYLVAANDELYSAQNGIWVQQGNQVAMFFGSPFFENKSFTGSVDTNELRLDQFDSSGGACLGE